MNESKAEEVHENEKERNIAWKVLIPIVKAKTYNHKERKNIEGRKRIEILTNGKRKKKAREDLKRVGKNDEEMFALFYFISVFELYRN